MTGELAKKLLIDYMGQTEKLFDDYMQEKIAEAREVGEIPAELIERFWQTARRGKKIRGALMVLGYQMMGGKEMDKILRASLSIEVLHAGLLVHDDIMDSDELRRGLPSLHVQFTERGTELGVKSNVESFGQAMALGAGDASFYFADELLVTSGFAPEVVLEAHRVFATYVQRIAYGQILDVANVSLHNLSEKDILNVLRYKAAEYTGVLPLLLGAILAGCDDQAKQQAIIDYGLAFGWAFQIQDDILALYGDPKKTGKPVGSDIQEGKNTLLMLYALRSANEEEKEFLQKSLGNKDITQEEIDRVIEIIKSSGAYQKVIDMGWNYVEEGKKIVPTITQEKEYADILDSLIYFMMERIL